MSAARRHGEVVLAGLIVLGILVGVAAAAFELFPDAGRITKACVLFVAAFVAGHVTRRLLAIELGQLGISMLVTIAVGAGITASISDDRVAPLDVRLLVMIAAATVGAVAGGALARRQYRHWLVLVVTISGAALGGLVMAAGVLELVGLTGRHQRLLCLVGPVLGTSVFAWLVDGTRTRHGVLGLGAFFCGMMVAMGKDASTVIGGLLLGMLLGTPGTWLGSKLRARRADLPEAHVRKPDLPEVRQVS